jgi:type III secretory pathway component EscV
LSFVLIALRSTIGDYSFGDFLTADNFQIALVVWLLIMILGNMVFNNYIIAVVNSSYDYCIANMEARQFKIMLDMIVECESMMKFREL